MNIFEDWEIEALRLIYCWDSSDLKRADSISVAMSYVYHYVTCGRCGSCEFSRAMVEETFELYDAWNRRHYGDEEYNEFRWRLDSFAENGRFLAIEELNANRRYCNCVLCRKTRVVDWIDVYYNGREN